MPRGPVAGLQKDLLEVGPLPARDERVLCRYLTAIVPNRKAHAAALHGRTLKHAQQASIAAFALQPPFFLETERETSRPRRTSPKVLSPRALQPEM